MEEDNEYVKLPVEERCVHKLWKARVHGYEEAVNVFRRIDDEKSPEWNKFVGLIKKFVVDSNAAAQEKGLEAVLVFLENSGFAGRTVGDVMAGVVSKCIGAPKAKTKELAGQICLIAIEIEKQEVVVEELLKGTESKNPKITAGCINILCQALSAFGSKVVNINKILKRVSTLLEDRDKSVRDESKQMLVEIYRWTGGAIRPQLSNIKPVTLSELETEFEKIKGMPRPTRLLKSQQAISRAAPSEDAGQEDGQDETDDPAVPEVDPFDLLDPVDILSKLPKDFYSKIEEKKWTERKEALEALEKALAAAPKLEVTDYGDLIRALKKMITKDSNVVVVALAIKCTTGLATGLKKKFSPYVGALFPALLEKFKEKKQNVVLALRDCVDAAYVGSNVENLQEDLLAALDNKNPAVKAETLGFLGRAFTKCTPTILHKKLLKVFTVALLKCLNESDPVVRDNAAVAIGTAMKVVGEKAMGPLLVDVDNTKMTKIKECYDKAEVIKVKEKKPIKEKAPEAKPPADKVIRTGGKSAATAKGAASKPASQPQPKPAAPKASTGLAPAGGCVPPNLEAELRSQDDNERISAASSLHSMIESMPYHPDSSKSVLRALNQSPGLGDPAVQARVTKLECVKRAAFALPIELEGVEEVVLEVARCLTESGEVKDTSKATLVALADSTSLDQVACILLTDDSVQGQPSWWAEVLHWLSDTVIQGQVPFDSEALLVHAKSALENRDSLVRTAALALIGTLHLNNGGAKVQGTVRVARPKVIRPDRAIPDRTEAVIEESLPSPDNAGPSSDGPKIDISPKLNEALVAELCDKNWKIRAEAVNKVQSIVNDAKGIQANLGEVPASLGARVTDSNIKIAVSAISLIESIVTAMGPPVRQHTRYFLPPLLKAIGDPKPWVRTAATQSLDALWNTGGSKEFFEGELIADALKTGSPTLRAELWNWLSTKLPSAKSPPKEELTACLPTLYNNLEDRNAEVRKSAALVIVGFMTHLGYSNMLSVLDNMKGSNQVKMMLEKNRGLVPERPSSKGKMGAPSSGGIEKSSSAGSGIPKGGATASKPGVVKSRSKTSLGGSKVAAPGSRKRDKDEDADIGPLLEVNSMKHQRVVDEQKMKTLKWNFTTPRQEYIDLLREQMLSANVSKTLVMNMFHNDFQYHLRAIESLAEDLQVNRTPPLTSNLDLILKWMTIRFFDTNPSVLLKGLEYLTQVFALLTQQQYAMLDNEAASFLPYLILKAGDPKDTVRNSVRTLLRQISAIYPISKEFNFVMDGLKSKNSRQRSECLEHLGWLIESYGLSACHNQPAGPLKDIAKHIADRDTTVRNAALNCIVAAYFLEGEKILKMVGRISDKDMSMLDERIKRAAKNRPVASVRPLQQVEMSPPPSHPPSQQSAVSAEDLTEPEPEPDNPDLNSTFTRAEQECVPSGLSPRNQNTQNSRSHIQGPYGLDHNVIDEIERNMSRFTQPRLADIDYQFLQEKTAESINPVPVTKGIRVTPSLSTMAQPTALKWELTQIGTTDIEKAIASISQIDLILTSDKKLNLLGLVDLMVNQLVNQLLVLENSNHPELVNCYRACFSLLLKLFSQPELCQQVSQSPLQSLLTQLIQLLIEQRLDALDHQGLFNKVVNNLVIKVLEAANKTNVLCALLRMLCASLSQPTSDRYQDLAIKCIWKLNRTQSEWDKELNYVRVLSEINTFFQDYPTAWWKNQPADVPLRTIKTILHSMVKIRGAETREYLRQVPGILPDSEVATYVRRVVKHLKMDEAQGGGDSAARGGAASQDADAQITAIFTAIANPEQRQEGLRRLYHFKNSHPNVNLDALVARGSTDLQNIIRRGLAAVEASYISKRYEEKTEDNCSQDQRLANNAYGKESERLRSRLEQLKNQSNMEGHSGV